MYCRSCGEEISESSGRCPYCGAPVDGGASYGGASDDLESYDVSDYWNSGSGDNVDNNESYTVNLYDNKGWVPPKKKKSKLPLILGILAVLLLCFGVGKILAGNKETKKEDETSIPLEQVGYERVCKFTVRTEGKQICYVYMEYIGEPTYSTEERKSLGKKGGNPNVAFLVYPGQDTVIYMPIGNYSMYVAEGDKWINVKEKFGPDTELFGVDYEWEFYKTANGYCSRTLTMDSKSGDIDIYGIDETDFPDQMTDSEVIK